MSTKKTVLLGLLLIVGGVLYRAGGRAPDANDAEAAPTARAALLAMPHRIERGIGIFGAKLATGTVERMLADTEVKLAELQASVKGVKRGRIETKKSADAAKAVLALNDGSREQLTNGHPIASFKLAMQANGLITVLRDNTKREVIR